MPGLQLYGLIFEDNTEVKQYATQANGAGANITAVVSRITKQASYANLCSYVHYATPARDFKSSERQLFFETVLRRQGEHKI